ncbi:hypothetical protein COOONC_18602 [Cooperia oncophora]
MLLSVLLIFSAFATVAVDAGCYQRRMCCAGRNTTCKTLLIGNQAFRDESILGVRNIGIEIFFFRHKSSSEAGPFSSYHTPYYEASGDGYDLIYPDVYEDQHHQRIGKIVFPDIVELEGSGAEDLYTKYVQDKASREKAIRVPKTRRHKKKTSPARKITHFLFGYPEGPEEPPEEILRYTSRPKHLLIAVCWCLFCGLLQ